MNFDLHRIHKKSGCDNWAFYLPAIKLPNIDKIVFF